MAKYFRSTKIYIYISLFACLFNLITNDQEGYYYITTFEKAWKITLNDTPNAKKLAEKLKSEKSMTMIFGFSNVQINNGRDLYYFNVSQKFNFEATTKKVSFNLLT